MLLGEFNFLHNGIEISQSVKLMTTDYEPASYPVFTWNFFFLSKIVMV